MIFEIFLNTDIFFQKSLSSSTAYQLENDKALMGCWVTTGPPGLQPPLKPQIFQDNNSRQHRIVQAEQVPNKLISESHMIK